MAELEKNERLDKMKQEAQEKIKHAQDKAR